MDNLAIFENSRNYHDLNSLAQLKGKGDSRAAITEAARQFESIFYSMMMQSMRDASKAIVDEPMFDSPSMTLFQDMYDKQLSLNIGSSAESSLGLAPLLVEQLTRGRIFSDEPKDITQPAPNMVPERRSFPKKLELPETSSAQSQAPEVGVVNTVAKLVPESPVESRGVDFSSPMAFVSSLLPYARKYAQQLNLDPKVLLAQAALETGWGKFVMRTADGISSNNLFGIKAGNDWQGPSARIQSLEYDNGQLKQIKSAFRAYDNHQQSFKDYVEFIQQGPRYQKAVQSADSSKSYLNELQAAGYATDPDYAQKIHSIYQSDTLNSAVEQVEAQFMTR